jgi:hypothetical protein
MQGMEVVVNVCLRRLLQRLRNADAADFQGTSDGAWRCMDWAASMRAAKLTLVSLRLSQINHRPPLAHPFC